MFASEDDPFFPARAVLPRARELFSNLVHTECLADCRHVPSESALGHLGEYLRVFLTDSDRD